MVIVFMRASIGTTFLASALFKLVAPSAFIDSLPALGAPIRFARAVGVTVIVSEAIVAACMLLGGPALAAGMTAGTALLLLFSAVVAWAFARGVRANCYCFGSGSTPISRVDLVRNGGFLVVLAMGGVASAVSGPNPFLSVGTATFQAPIEAIVAAAAGLGFAMVWSQLPEIVRLVAAVPYRHDMPHGS